MDNPKKIDTAYNLSDSQREIKKVEKDLILIMVLLSRLSCLSLPEKKIKAIKVRSKR